MVASEPRQPPIKNREPVIALVVARAANHVIGNNNQLPWHLPQDLQHFKRVTMGKPIIMGRKTFESIGRPLPGRLNIVLSGQQGWNAAGVDVASGLDQALQLAKNQRVEEIMIIGGAGVYAQALPYADRIYLTEVKCEFEGDARFPDLDMRQWFVVKRDDGFDSCSDIGFSFVTLERIRVG